VDIKRILKIKLPFLFLFGVSLFLVFSDFVLSQSLKNREDVLGVSKKAGIESNSGKNSPDVGAHVSKVKNTALEIKKIAKTEKEVGNVEVGDEIIKSVDEISYTSVDNINSLEEVANRPAWKSFLLGPDYKNLGQIRSNLVKTENQIKNIEKTMEKNMGEDESNALRARLGELEEERLTIFNYIDERDDGFSLFGWLAKLLSGYNKNIEEEEVLNQEVEIDVEDVEIEPEVGEEEDGVIEELNEDKEDENTGEPEENADTEVVEETEETEDTEVTEVTE